MANTFSHKVPFCGNAPMPSSECWNEINIGFGWNLPFVRLIYRRRPPPVHSNAVRCGATCICLYRICWIVIASTGAYCVVAFLRPLTRHAHFHTNNRKDLYLCCVKALMGTRLPRWRATHFHIIELIRAVYSTHLTGGSSAFFRLLIFEEKKKTNETKIFFSFSLHLFFESPVPLESKLSAVKFANKQSGETSLYVLLRSTGPKEMTGVGVSVAYAWSFSFRLCVYFISWGGGYIGVICFYSNLMRLIINGIMNLWCCRRERHKSCSCSSRRDSRRNTKRFDSQTHLTELIFLHLSYTFYSLLKCYKSRSDSNGSIPSSIPWKPTTRIERLTQRVYFWVKQSESRFAECIGATRQEENNDWATSYT